MTDAPSRVERVLNLLACLLDAGRPLTQEELVREVAGYPPDKTAHRRAFERDKETLRGMGVPLTVEQPRDGGEAGYRVHPDDYYLPDLGLTPEETAALRVAVSAVSLGSPAGEGALMKLGGFEGRAAAPIASLPLVPALPALFDAFRRHSAVTFIYRGERRHLEPWGVTSRWGHWYVAGRDSDRGAVRVFRADRIEGGVDIGEPGSFAVPIDFSPDEHLPDEPWLFGGEEPVRVRLLVDAGHTGGVVDRVGEDAVVEQREDGAVVVELTAVNRAALRSFVLGFLEHAEVLGPPEVRTEVTGWLEAVVASA